MSVAGWEIKFRASQPRLSVQHQMLSRNRGVGMVPLFEALKFAPEMARTESD